MLIICCDTWLHSKENGSISAMRSGSQNAGTSACAGDETGPRTSWPGYPHRETSRRNHRPLTQRLPCPLPRLPKRWTAWSRLRCSRTSPLVAWSSSRRTRACSARRWEWSRARRQSSTAAARPASRPPSLTPTVPIRRAFRSTRSPEAAAPSLTGPFRPRTTRCPPRRTLERLAWPPSPACAKMAR